MSLKDELIDELGKLFDDLVKKGITYQEIQRGVDNLIYPFIGSYISDGSLKREEGEEVFNYCEQRLRDLRRILENG
jgi:polyhydroxyalkanoate synthesis regulator phasin